MEMEGTDQIEKTHKSCGTRKQGGFRTLPFIIANESFEKVASYGLHANMILYLIYEYHMSPTKGTSVLFLWNAISNFMPSAGAFLSDSYYGRFRVIAAGTIVSLTGLSMLWLTSILTQARPPKCNLEKGEACAGATSAQLLLLFMSFGLMSVGAGGIRSCSLPFGADQIANPGDPKNERTLQSYFNWYYASVGVSITVSVTVIVYVQQEAGWAVGFGVPMGMLFLATLSFLLGSALYLKVRPNKSMFTSFTQVIAAAWKSRHLPLPPNDSDGSFYYHNYKGSKIVAPTKKLRYLNKACVIRQYENDLDCGGVAIDPWRVCSIKQVEELKALIKVMPIWSTGIMIAVTISQTTFPVLQANTMDRKPFTFSSFKIPASSFAVFTILTLTVWVGFYDRVLVPILTKYTKFTNGFTLKQRMGMGLIISCAATAVAAEVERQRRGIAIRQGYSDNSKSIVDMSAMWLVPQYCLIGLAEALNAIGQVEFYYSQFPKSMSSIGIALVALGQAVGNLVGTAIVNVLDGVTKNGENGSWVGDNLNKGHYDYYYWLLTILSVANVFYYFVCAWSYGSCEEDKKNWELWEEEERIGIQEGEVLSSMPSPIVIIN